MVNNCKLMLIHFAVFQAQAKIFLSNDFSFAI